LQPLQLPEIKMFKEGLQKYKSLCAQIITIFLPFFFFRQDLIHWVVL